jgi:aromatic ring-opening dioxygenase catalytic subunit (LigB family)
MGKIVAAFSCGHTALMIRRFEAADPQQRARVMEAFAEVGRRLAQARADALIVVGTDHLKTFFFDNMPAFCLGVGEECRAWGEGGVPKYTVKVHQPLARAILRGCIERGFDLASSEEMPLDHGFMTPLHFIRPEMDIPIIPLFQNCSAPPQPGPERCYRLGQAIRAAIEELGGDQRVALLGTGGLSHWVGHPQMGTINADFDRHILELIQEGRERELTSLKFRDVEEKAGNGANEIRNWITVLGAVNGAKGEVLAYEPVEAWATGIGIVSYSVNGGGQ